MILTVLVFCLRSTTQHPIMSPGAGAVAVSELYSAVQCVLQQFGWLWKHFPGIERNVRIIFIYMAHLFFILVILVVCFAMQHWHTEERTNTKMMMMMIETEPSQVWWTN